MSTGETHFKEMHYKLGSWTFTRQEGSNKGKLSSCIMGLHIYHVWVQSDFISTGEIDFVRQRAGGTGNRVASVVNLNCGS